jgi:hypothetical protein
LSSWAVVRRITFDWKRVSTHEETFQANNVAWVRQYDRGV